jgi:DnaJ-class molecular chaperone
MALMVLSESGDAQPRILKKARQGDCVACHGKKRFLPSDHVPTKNLDAGECKTCHQEGSGTLRGRLPLSHLHGLAGIGCEQCHGKGKTMKPVKQEKCVSCHGSREALVAKTEQVKPANPHTSPHYGSTLDCNFCHHQHGRSENLCEQCHSYKFLVP